MTILFKALGVTTDKDIARLCTLDLGDEKLMTLLEPSLLEGNLCQMEDKCSVKTQEDAIRFIGTHQVHLLLLVLNGSSLT